MSEARPNSYRLGPDASGHFGDFGGRFVAETLMPLLLKLEQAYNDVKDDPAFHAELNGLLKHYVGRPNPLYLAERLTKHLGGAKIYFKREDLNHTGAHKINNCLGQILLAKRMGKTPHHRRDGRGPAWRRHRDGRGAVRSSVRRSTWARWTSSGRSRTCSA